MQPILFNIVSLMIPFESVLMNQMQVAGWLLSDPNSNPQYQ